MKGFSHLRNVTTLAYERERCIGCGMCAAVCPHGVFTMENGKSRVVLRDACMECGACKMNCPSFAIEVDAGVGCAAGLIQEWLRSVSTCRKDLPGCC